jgi:hypothetical protein
MTDVMNRLPARRRHALGALTALTLAACGGNSSDSSSSASKQRHAGRPEPVCRRVDAGLLVGHHELHAGGGQQREHDHAHADER